MNNYEVQRKMNTQEFILRHGIIAICRKVYGNELLELARALCKGGVKLIEVTFDQADADCCATTAENIRMLCTEMGESMQIGAGTVLDTEQLHCAAEAGARYIIAPNANPELIRETKRLGLVSIPGAMTPSEIQQAHECGADFVKLFPAKQLGLGYIKDIRAPLSHIKLLATAGVNDTNLRSFLEAGCMGAGISGYLTDKELIRAGRFDEISERAAKLVSIFESVG